MQAFSFYRTLEQKKKPTHRLEKAIENFVYTICAFFMITLGVGLPLYLGKIKLGITESIIFLVNIVN
jgi:hypothetical protein